MFWSPHSQVSHCLSHTHWSLSARGQWCLHWIGHTLLSTALSTSCLWTQASLHPPLSELPQVQSTHPLALPPRLSQRLNLEQILPLPICSFLSLIFLYSGVQTLIFWIQQRWDQSSSWIYDLFIWKTWKRWLRNLYHFFFFYITVHTVDAPEVDSFYFLTNSSWAAFSSSLSDQFALSGS